MSPADRGCRTSCQWNPSHTYTCLDTKSEPRHHRSSKFYSKYKKYENYVNATIVRMTRPIFAIARLAAFFAPTWLWAPWRTVHSLPALVMIDHHHDHHNHHNYHYHHNHHDDHDDRLPDCTDTPQWLDRTHASSWRSRNTGKHTQSQIWGERRIAQKIS